MVYSFGKFKIVVIMDDITELSVDCVVNAANKTLLGGGGVDGAIHRKAGPDLLEECKKLNGCSTGKAKITGGYNLKAPYIIHTVGPIWEKIGNIGKSTLLRSCYKNSLRLANEYGIKSIAFPCISTGIYNYPKDKATQIAITSVIEELSKSELLIDTVVFCCFEVDMYEMYMKMLAPFCN